LPSGFVVFPSLRKAGRGITSNIREDKYAVELETIDRIIQTQLLIEKNSMSEKNFTEKWTKFVVDET
jgi:hypothetical protein